VSPPPIRWEQFDVALARPAVGGAAASARHVFSLLDDPLAAWRRSRLVTHVWFVRKPPDLRLRIGGPGLDPAVAVEVRRVLGRARRDGAVVRATRSVYEPETRKFGGPGAMAAVHRWADADTTAWRALDRRGAGLDATPALVDALVGARLDDLFVRGVEDHGEIWDCWWNLGSGVDAAAGVTQLDVGHAVAPADLDELVAGLVAAGRADDAATVDTASEAGARLIRALHRERAAGRLGVGLRAVLAHVGRGCCNRWGVGSERQAALVVSRAARWDPARGMRGGPRAGGP
jgi:thiopeptide-type bacteriocin biosynthesis protein